MSHELVYVEAYCVDDSCPMFGVSITVATVKEDETGTVIIEQEECNFCNSALNLGQKEGNEMAKVVSNKKTVENSPIMYLITEYDNDVVAYGTYEGMEEFARDYVERTGSTVFFHKVLKPYGQFSKTVKWTSL